MTTVLLVEDDSDLQSEYAASLRQSGFDVVTASDGMDMESIVTDSSFDILVSDTNLTTRDGDIACKHLVEKGYLSRTLIIGMSDDRNCEEYWHGLAYDFIYKGDITNLGITVTTRYKEFLSGYPPRIGPRSRGGRDLSTS